MKAKDFFLERTNKTLYILSLQLLIGFAENELSVYYLEVKKGNFLFDGMDLFKKKFTA